MADESSVRRTPSITTANPSHFPSSDCWTRYIGVGNMFSGLEIPFEDRPELQPDKVACLSMTCAYDVCI